MLQLFILLKRGMGMAVWQDGGGVIKYKFNSTWLCEGTIKSDLTFCHVCHVVGDTALGNIVDQKLRNNSSTQEEGSTVTVLSC